MTSARRENNSNNNDDDDDDAVLVVTGCLGFIGSHFCERVLTNSNARVIGIDRADVDLGPYKKEHKRANLEHLMRRRDMDDKIVNEFATKTRRYLFNFFFTH